MIATCVTRPLPAMVEAAAGKRALAAIFASAEVSELAPQSAGRFMPQRNVLALLEASARVLGVRGLGLLYGPRLDVADWGIWGAYVRGAPTLESALRRSGSAMRYHVSMDTLICETRGDEVRFIHRAALGRRVGYRYYAACAVSAMISLVRAFTGSGWSPRPVEFDLPGSRETGAWEDFFHCAVVFDRPDLAVVFPRDLSTIPGTALGRPQVTIADLRRLVAHGVPRTFVAEVAEIVRLRLLEGSFDIEGLARQTALGPRTLQRRLGEAGLSYRELIARIRTERALDLLRESDVAVTEIAGELGYATPSHFARASRRETGRPPSVMRGGVEAAAISRFV